MKVVMASSDGLLRAMISGKHIEGRYVVMATMGGGSGRQYMSEREEFSILENDRIREATLARIGFLHSLGFKIVEQEGLVAETGLMPMLRSENVVS